MLGEHAGPDSTFTPHDRSRATFPAGGAAHAITYSTRPLMSFTVTAGHPADGRGPSARGLIRFFAQATSRLLLSFH